MSLIPRSRWSVKRFCNLATNVSARPLAMAAALAVCLAAVLGWGSVALAVDVPLLGELERSFTQTGSYANAYKSVNATATLHGPGGQTLTTPLFWDGGNSWKFRYSPDAVGAWSYSISSNDAGLNAGTGAFNVTPSTNHGGLQPLTGRPYALQYQDGTPFYMQGDTQWVLYGNNAGENLSRTTVNHYIDTRAAQGFNVVTSVVKADGYDNQGGAPFSNFSTETLNPAYWQEMDSRVDYLNSKGITAGLYLSFGDQWDNFSDNAARLRYARYVTARYSADNVFFIVTNEYEDSNLGSSFFNTMGAQVAADDPNGRLIGIHSTGSVESFATQPWMSFGDYDQGYTNLHKDILAARDHNKPVVNGEYAYYLRDQSSNGIVDKPNSATINDIRHAAWDIAMAGGFSVTGFGTTYFGGHRDPGPFNVDVAKNDIWEAQSQNVRKLFETIDWWNLNPADSLITASFARGSDTSTPLPSSTPVDSGYTRPPLATYWAMADPGDLYVAYVRGQTGNYLLALGSGITGTFDLTRFDPRTGVSLALGRYTGSGPITFNSPDTQDWVFTATAVAIPEPASLGLLAAGAMTLLLLRKRRSTVARSP